MCFVHHAEAATLVASSLCAPCQEAERPRVPSRPSTPEASLAAHTRIASPPAPRCGALQLRPLFSDLGSGRRTVSVCVCVFSPCSLVRNIGGDVGVAEGVVARAGEAAAAQLPDVVFVHVRCHGVLTSDIVPAVWGGRPLNRPFVFRSCGSGVWERGACVMWITCSGVGGERPLQNLLWQRSGLGSHLELGNVASESKRPAPKAHSQRARFLRLAPYLLKPTVMHGRSDLATLASVSLRCESFVITWLECQRAGHASRLGRGRVWWSTFRAVATRRWARDAQCTAIERKDLAHESPARCAQQLSDSI